MERRRQSRKEERERMWTIRSYRNAAIWRGNFLCPCAVISGLLARNFPNLMKVQVGKNKKAMIRVLMT